VRYRRCPVCDGTGKDPNCHGTGRDPFTNQKCVFCRGTGKCRACNGTGRVETIEEEDEENPWRGGFD